MQAQSMFIDLKERAGLQEMEMVRHPCAMHSINTAAVHTLEPVMQAVFKGGFANLQRWSRQARAEAHQNWGAEYMWSQLKGKGGCEGTFKRFSARRGLFKHCLGVWEGTVDDKDMDVCALFRQLVWACYVLKPWNIQREMDMFITCILVASVCALKRGPNCLGLVHVHDLLHIADSYSRNHMCPGSYSEDGPEKCLWCVKKIHQNMPGAPVSLTSRICTFELMSRMLASDKRKKHHLLEVKLRESVVYGVHGCLLLPEGKGIQKLLCSGATAHRMRNFKECDKKKLSAEWRGNILALVKRLVERDEGSVKLIMNESGDEPELIVMDPFVHLPRAEAPLPPGVVDTSDDEQAGRARAPKKDHHDDDGEDVRHMSTVQRVLLCGCDRHSRDHFDAQGVAVYGLELLAVLKLTEEEEGYRKAVWQ
jgi:hypothetical protein